MKLALPASILAQFLCAVPTRPLEAGAASLHGDGGGSSPDDAAGPAGPGDVVQLTDVRAPGDVDGVTVDTGVISYVRALQGANQSPPGDTWIHCHNGYQVVDSAAKNKVYVGENGTAISCSTACSGNCCTGKNACFFYNTDAEYNEPASEGFSGKVKNDGSCKGEKACVNANIPEVSQRSCVGEKACQNAEVTGKVTEESCTGKSSCYSLKQNSEVSQKSCVGEEACRKAEVTGDITMGSCAGNKACKDAFVNGTITGASCTGVDACHDTHVRSDSGGVCNDCKITEGSCNGVMSCFNMERLSSGSMNTTLVGDCVGLSACCYDSSTVSCPSTEAPTLSPTDAPTCAPTPVPLLSSSMNITEIKSLLGIDELEAELVNTKAELEEAKAALKRLDQLEAHSATCKSERDAFHAELAACECSLNNFKMMDIMARQERLENANNARRVCDAKEAADAAKTEGKDGKVKVARE